MIGKGSALTGTTEGLLRGGPLGDPCLNPIAPLYSHVQPTGSACIRRPEHVGR